MVLALALDKKTYTAYQNKMFSIFIDTNAEFVHCKTPDCDYVIQADIEKAAGKKDDFTCPKCQKHFCLDCYLAPHPGMTCAENKINR